MTNEEVLAKLTASQDFDAFVVSMGFSSEPEQQPERSLWKNYFSGAKAAIEAGNGALFVETMITYVINELDKWEAAKAKAAAARAAGAQSAQPEAAQPAQPEAAQPAQPEAAQPAAEEAAAQPEAAQAAAEEEAATPPPLPAAIEQWMVDTGIRKIMGCHGNCVAISHLVPYFGESEAEILQREEEVKKAQDHHLVHCFGWRKDADGEFMTLPTLEQCEQWIEAYKIAHPKEDLNFSESEEEASESEEEYSDSDSEAEEVATCAKCSFEAKAQSVGDLGEIVNGQFYCFECLAELEKKGKGDGRIGPAAVIHALNAAAAEKEEEEAAQPEAAQPEAAQEEAAQPEAAQEEAAGQKRKAADALESPQAAKKPKEEEQQQIEKLPPVIDLTEEAPAEKAQVITCAQCAQPITTSIHVVGILDTNEEHFVGDGYNICGRCAHSYPFA